MFIFNWVGNRFIREGASRMLGYLLICGVVSQRKGRWHRLKGHVSLGVAVF
jgi:hypothetical protein